MNGIYSRNVTLPNSPGFTNKSDPVYTNIPPASPRPPEPIDASGEIMLEFHDTPELINMVVSKWFHISSAQV